MKDDEKFEWYGVNFGIKTRALDGDVEDGDLIQEFTGKIICTDEDEKETTIGNVVGARIFCGEALNRGASLYDACDSQSQGLHDYYMAMFDSEGEFRKELELEEFGDVLIVNQVEIIPKYRGRGLGLLAMLQTLLALGGGCALAVIKPFPLQFAGDVNIKNKMEFSRSEVKLRAYWQRFGFQRIGDGDYYYFKLSRRLPRPEDLCDWIDAVNE